MQTPNGYQELVQTFGDITKYIRADGMLSQDWERDELALVDVPFSMKLSWDPTTLVSKIKCHRLLVGTIHAVFQEIVNQNLQGQVREFGGCFNYRSERKSKKLSTHAWGISLDLNPEEDEQGTAGSMTPELVKVFTDAGFVWGGTFAGTRIDPQHFQFCTGY